MQFDHIPITLYQEVESLVDNTNCFKLGRVNTNQYLYYKFKSLVCSGKQNILINII